MNGVGQRAEGWEWYEHETSRWHRYSGYDSSQIDAAQQRGSGSFILTIQPARGRHPKQYSIDLNALTQTNTHTRMARPIRDARRPAPNKWEWSAPDKTSPFGVLLEWRAYEDPLLLQQLEAEHQQQVHGGVVMWKDYAIDVNKMQQTNIYTHKVRKIRRVANLNTAHTASALPTAPPTVHSTALSDSQHSVGAAPAGRFLPPQGSVVCSGEAVTLSDEEVDAVIVSVTEGGDGDSTPVPLGDGEKCVICLCEVKAEDGDAVTLMHCGKGVLTGAESSSNGGGGATSNCGAAKGNGMHYFHRGCILDYAKHAASKGGFCCPVCKTMQIQGRGDCPRGTMTWQTYAPHNPEGIRCAGNESFGTILITYTLPNGLQGPHHSTPGAPYKGATRTAYIPDTLQGRVMLKLLVKAFERGHTFTIGQSVTTGRENQVVWASIHHKTRMEGGEVQHGWPDPSYFERLEAELRAKGVTADEDEGDLLVLQEARERQGTSLDGLIRGNV
eukprot:GDKI01003540.1.p1 GENE.GDKI01003540.1~~GDKI01003540.1.p1  ORF type:complete len:499 (-),score=134.82 GDKI01003540.1:205-1701(-)